MIQGTWFEIFSGILSYYYVEIIFVGTFLLTLSIIIFYFTNIPKRVFTSPLQSNYNDFEMTLNKEFHNVGSDREDE